MGGELFKKALEGAAVAEAEALAGVLEVALPATSSGLIGESAVSAMWERLSYLGSNDIAYLLRGLEGVEYAEIVGDVCKRMRIDVSAPVLNAESDVVRAEQALMKKLFADVWDRMTEEQRLALLKEMNLGAAQVRLGGGAAAAAVIAGSLGGFGTYQITVIVANAVARAILGRGLAFGANAALTRAIGAALGPVGWIASGLWLAVDLASPAFRKTVPAIVQVACLRQITIQRKIIGVMGHGSTGKDSLLRYLFGIDTRNIHPIPGATANVKLYDAQTTIVPTRVLNFPGFGDLRPQVDAEVRDQARNCSVIIYLFNGAEIPKRDEVNEYKRYSEVNGKGGKVHVIPVLNKWDKADDDERDEILGETAKRIAVPQSELICTSLKEKRGNTYFDSGLTQLRHRINAWAESHGHAPLFPRDALP